MNARVTETVTTWRQHRLRQTLQTDWTLKPCLQMSLPFQARLEHNQNTL